MYRVTVRGHAMIAHSLPDPAFGPAQSLHGATYVVEATFYRRDLDEQACVVDIGAATDTLGTILADLNYRNLDDHPAFTGKLSTTEVVARHVADRLLEGPLTRGLAKLDVVLREHPDAWAGYSVELAEDRPDGTAARPAGPPAEADDAIA
jgi:6-pyruvoyltetrahydropterin/6-carboxytetrahydropterin synthase